FEMSIGFLGVVVFIVIALDRVYFVLLSLLSFLVYMHGKYRRESK
ncbi:unnamed protein product, partial [marine sediment metagenome]